jgi:hypothetical protein
VVDAHPCAPALLLAGPPRSAEAFRVTELALEILERAGLPPPEAAALVRQMTTLLVAPYVVYGAGAGDRGQRSGEVGMGDEGEGGEGIARGDPGEMPPLDGLPRLRAALPHMAEWSDPRRDRELAVELLVGGVEALRRRATRSPR